ncbi:MAG: hypothetical protein KAR20_27585, partial [Candidatus Heimdallarchaeota archaeon]|nr:hypothetical protein [Candidatus Heimdallarchaeota archaeon]
DKGISLQDLEISGQTADLQIESDHFDTPLVFSFSKTQHFILMVVSESQLTPIFPLLEKTVLDFDQEFVNNTESETSPSEIRSRSILIIGNNFSKYFLRNFLIPVKINNDPQEKGDSEKNSEDSVDHSLNSSQQEIYQAIDDVWTIEDLMANSPREENEFRDVLFSLWIQNWIIFRMKYSPWDEFRQTEAAPPYMNDGSPENLKLIQKYNTNKIIRLLQTIGTGSSYHSLTQEFELTRTKLDLFLMELLAENVVIRQSLVLKIDRISEDLLPLLSMQGFNKEDFTILSQLEKIIDGTQNLDAIALKLNIDPFRIRNLLSKLENSLHILR